MIHEPMLPPDATTHQDRMLAEGSTYTYKVRAYSQNGLSTFTGDLETMTLASLTPVIWSADFNDGGFGQMSTVSVASNADWSVYEYDGGFFARINGYGADMASDDWLITPSLNLLSYTGEHLACDLAYNYDGPEIEVLVSDNYDPNVHADPGAANWRDMGPTMPSVGGCLFETAGALPFSLASADFDDGGFGVFTTHSAASNADWNVEERGGKMGAVANGFGADGPSEDWLISPGMAVSAGAEIEVFFNLYRKYGGPELQVMISEDYAGSGDPNAATWAPYSIPHEDIYDEWKPVSVVHAITGDATVYAAFLYI